MIHAEKLFQLLLLTDYRLVLSWIELLMITTTNGRVGMPMAAAVAAAIKLRIESRQDGSTSLHYPALVAVQAAWDSKTMAMPVMHITQRTWRRLYVDFAPHSDVANELDSLDMVDETGQYEIIRNFAAKHIVPYTTGQTM